MQQTTVMKVKTEVEDGRGRSAERGVSRKRGRGVGRGGGGMNRLVVSHGNVFRMCSTVCVEVRIHMCIVKACKTMNFWWTHWTHCISTILFFSSVWSTIFTLSTDKLVKRLDFYFCCSKECSSISLFTKLAWKVNTLTIKPDIISSCAGLPAPVVAHYINFMFIVFLIQYPSRKYMVI